VPAHGTGTVVWDQVAKGHDDHRRQRTSCHPAPTRGQEPRRYYGSCTWDDYTSDGTTVYSDTTGRQLLHTRKKKVTLDMGFAYVTDNWSCRLVDKT
jgi:hypothetical protein